MAPGPEEEAFVFSAQLGRAGVGVKDCCVSANQGKGTGSAVSSSGDRPGLSPVRVAQLPRLPWPPSGARGDHMWGGRRNSKPILT